MSMDDTIAFDPFDPAQTPPGITTIPEFEPVLNTQAAASFIIIAIVFTLLQLRINAVSNAAKRRSIAREVLRKVEALLLSDSDASTGEQVTRAKVEYENALKEELGLRTILPGIRIVAPNDPTRDAKERADAKRFLGWGNDEFGDDPEGEIDNKTIGMKEMINRKVQNDDEDAGLSNISKLILAGVASVLIVLLWTLSFDPMVAFTTLGGDPPSDIPYSSW